MRAHILQHVAFEGPGSMAAWLAARNAVTTFTHFHDAQATLPDLSGIDLVIAMGGPMSVNDEAEHPWLVAEKAFIRDAIARGLPVLGVCLGSQLIANALGARVYPNAEKEIGWFPVLREAAGAGAFSFPASVDVFHWHGETYDLPSGAVRLARSVACQNQAFQFGARVIGLQFHLETTPESAQAIIAQCGNELVAAPWIQSADDMLARPASAYNDINALMSTILTWLTRADASRAIPAGLLASG